MKSIFGEVLYAGFLYREDSLRLQQKIISFFVVTYFLFVELQSDSYEFNPEWNLFSERSYVPGFCDHRTGMRGGELFCQQHPFSLPAGMEMRQLEQSLHLQPRLEFKVIRKFFLNHNKSFRWHLGDYEKHDFFPFEACERRNFDFCVFLRMCSNTKIKVSPLTGLQNQMEKNVFRNRRNAI